MEVIRKIMHALSRFGNLNLGDMWQSSIVDILTYSNILPSGNMLENMIFSGMGRVFWHSLMVSQQVHNVIMTYYHSCIISTCGLGRVLGASFCVYIRVLTAIRYCASPFVHIYLLNLFS